MTRFEINNEFGMMRDEENEGKEETRPATNYFLRQKKGDTGYENEANGERENNKIRV